SSRIEAAWQALNKKRDGSSADSAPESTTTKIPVNEDHLFEVDVEKLEIYPGKGPSQLDTKYEFDIDVFTTSISVLEIQTMGRGYIGSTILSCAFKPILLRPSATQRIESQYTKRSSNQ
ncbi:hypothetical protein HDV05_002610, partial [Chytridiales sp. JEL 0842]